MKCEEIVPLYLANATLPPLQACQLLLWTAPNLPTGTDPQVSWGCLGKLLSISVGKQCPLSVIFIIIFKHIFDIILKEC